MIGWMPTQLMRFTKNGEEYKPRKVHASLFRQDERFGIGEEDGEISIPFDLLINESHGLQFEASDHKLENGVTVTDHITRKLRSVTINGMFTNHPVRGDVIYSNYDRNPYKVNVDGRKELTENRAMDYIRKLEDIAGKRKPVRLVTSMSVFPSMIILDIKYSRTPKDGSAVKFSMTLREINFADVYTFDTTFKLHEYKEGEKRDNAILASNVETKGQVSASVVNEVGNYVKGVAKGVNQ